MLFCVLSSFPSFIFSSNPLIKLFKMEFVWFLRSRIYLSIFLHLRLRIFSPKRRYSGSLSEKYEIETIFCIESVMDSPFICYFKDSVPRNPEITTEEVNLVIIFSKSISYSFFYFPSGCCFKDSFSNSSNTWSMMVHIIGIWDTMNSCVNTLEIIFLRCFHSFP